MKEAIRAWLLADAGVSALTDVIAWSALPRGRALPSIALHLISAPRDYAMSGPTGLVTSRVQVDCWGATNADATALARAVNAALSGLRMTIDGVQIQGAFLENETDLTDASDAAPAELIYRVSQDYSIWHSE